MYYGLCWRCNLSGQIFHKSIAYKRFSKKDKKGLSLSSVYSRDLTSSVNWTPCFIVVNCSKSALEKMAAEKDIQPVQTVSLLFYGITYR